ncbi:outer membrane protein [Polycladidibacter hongkongensis]|uniref:outer membrane protein n=1 Tax=Polycladidibacter hongkongensis TaxID=1647556 RepID=UPI000833B24C|nr:outer membrane protein [Pseudovibrio hongkongensis]
MLRTTTVSALAFGLIATSAMAADLPQEVPQVVYDVPVTVQGYNWAGAYAGVNAGWSFAGVDAKGATVGALDDNTNGVSVGVHGGYNFMVSPNVVLGAEADIQYNDINNKVSGSKLSSDWNGSLRARAGYAVDRTLFYGTGGVAFAQFTASDAGAKDSKNAVGYVIGAGVEHALTENLTTRIEYAYQDFGKQKFDLTSGTETSKLNENLVRAGMSYKF